MIAADLSARREQNLTFLTDSTLTLHGARKSKLTCLLLREFGRFFVAFWCPRIKWINTNLKHLTKSSNSL
jgi:hypothetical protein